jgi:alpha-L-fucosidase
MHWGIHSVKGVQPSWAMIKDYPYGGELYPPERYYESAKEFNPENYDPDQWLAAARKAGFTYAVLTTKHHDGYALWPTAFGDMNTRVHMNGRDLLRPFVEACRRNGMKVGFYFSPRDWHYPGYPVEFDYNKRDEPRPTADPIANQLDFDAFYAYTLGQLHELLTNYGPIDVLWFDGMGWDGISDIHTDQTLAWIRSLQPGILINDRWGGTGDFGTPEWDLPSGPPDGWWENCISWNGHWGYNPEGRFQSAAWVIDRLVQARAWGGNFLLNVGPAPDGTMQAEFYERCGELAAWMEHNHASLIGADPSPGDDRAKVRSTTPGDAAAHGNTWYLHMPSGHEGCGEVRYVDKPDAVVSLATGEALAFEHADGTLRVTPPEPGPLDTVIAVTWSVNHYDDDIAKYLDGDRANPPAPGGILFAGSSTIRMWNLEKYFPGLNAMNRGFGGSQYDDLVHYSERVILPYRPRVIVLYSGDNDIAHGKNPERVFADFRALMAKIRHSLPDTQIVVLGIKPSIARWDKWGTMQNANSLMRDFALKNPDVQYVDGAPCMFGADGKPRPELLLKDGLHFSHEGYLLWSDLVRPLL